MQDNQSIKMDAGKPQITLVPRGIIREIANVRTYGVNKYGRKENWKEVDVERYRNALMRHILDYLDNPSAVDPESKIWHLSHAACNIAFLIELERDHVFPY